jgi:hypothetical protein
MVRRIGATVKADDGEIKVFIAARESTCSECGENLGSRARITLTRDRGALCLACADLDHPVFLPSGDPALTRRAKKNSRLHAVVLKWARTRKRYAFPVPLPPPAYRSGNAGFLWRKVTQ